MTQLYMTLKLPITILITKNYDYYEKKKNESNDEFSFVNY